MGTEISVYGVDQISVMAKAVAASNLFGVKSQDQAMALMLVAQAEGRHPALAARDYDIISGRPAKKSEAMLRDFLQSGGKVEWHELTDILSDATFSHPAGGSVRITWDMKRAAAAGLGTKDTWKKYPRQMLRARVVSEGIRTVCPMATSGMYVPEEVQDFDDKVVEAKFTEVKKPEPKPEVKDDVKDKSITQLTKEFGDALMIVPDSKALESHIKANADFISRLATEVPNWHQQVTSRIEAKRASFQANDLAIPAFLDRRETVDA